MLYDKFFNREYLLVVKQKGREVFSTDRLDVKFSIERLHVSSICQSSISVLGLDSERINSIATVARECFSNAQEMELTVELSAGYKGNCPIIYKGFIIGAHVDSPPNMWLHMRCVNYTELGEEPIPVSIDSRNSSRMTYVDFAKIVCRQLRMNPPDVSEYHAPPMDYINIKNTVQGMFTKSKAMSELNKINKDRWIVFYDMGRVYIADAKPDVATAKRIIFNKENGLLAASGVSFTNCNVTMFMQDCPPNVMLAEVESEFNIGANGVWTILGRKYEGHYRGNDWKVTYKLYLRDQLT